MIEPDSIPRRKPGNVEHGFERLRREAIDLVQEISGRTWTDYNLHDPGVTILEQLIYAITDLSYRCEFALQDYLADAEGELDLDAQALHAPAAIFSCRASTAADYRKLLLDALPQLDDAWLEEITPADGIRGLYRVSAKLSRDSGRQQQDVVEDEIRRNYRAARNLCEDIGEVRVVENVELELCADIEVDSQRLPADILGDIYFECAQHIARGAVVENYDRIDAEHESLDRLFDGPLTEKGFFADGDGARRSGIAVSSLISIISDIKGVRQIQQLYLELGGKKYYDRVPAANAGEAYDLALADSDGAVKVSLYTNGRRLRPSIDDARSRNDERRARYYASRSSKQNMDMLYQPPLASARPLKRYFSIQNQFPAIYGVNRFGVPESASPGEKARVRQLKGYLLIFEQFLANFLANLDSLDALFSPRTESGKSYAVQALDAAQVGDLDAVYPRAAEAAFASIVARFDNFNERKGRVLDYLLALYGERFSQNSLRNFNYYYSRDEADAVIVANKVAYLEDIVRLTRDRAAAPAYADASIYQRGGLDRRARLLLDLGQQEDWLTQVFDRLHIELLPQREYRQLYRDSDALRLTGSQEIDDDRYTQPMQFPPADELALENLRRELADVAPLANGLVSDSLMHRGIDMARYRVGRGSDSEPYRLYFELDDSSFWLLGTYDDRAAAERAANQLCRFLLLLNRASEGLHVVEHLLLRPHDMGGAAGDDDFYSFRISAVLPGWSKRCDDPEFRKLVCETLRLITPAHVFTEFYWLDFAQMSEFEGLYRAWMELKCNPRSDPGELDRGARAVRDFLLAARPPGLDEAGLAS